MMTAARKGFVSVESGREEMAKVGVGVLGYRLMGKAHSNAYQRMPLFFWPPVARPRLVAICGRTEEAVAEAAIRYGYEGYYTDWQEMIDDERIQMFVNCASADAHAEPCIAAARAGKHVFCEKPLALSAADARVMWEAAEEARVKHMTGFNYRFVPAVRFARQLVEGGALGQIYHFRARYLQDEDDHGRPFSWLDDRSQGGYGVLGDLGVHIIDLARFLLGEIESIGAITATFIRERPLPDRAEGTREVTTDDAFEATVRFANGAVGTLEASRIATGRKNQNTFEINGAKGSLVFDLERLNELQVYLEDVVAIDEVVGFTNVLVTERTHPFCHVWWGPGHIIGWEHTLIHEVEHFIRAVVEDEEVGPYGATFEDGYRALTIAEAIVESSASGSRVEIEV